MYVPRERAQLRGQQMSTPFRRRVVLAAIALFTIAPVAPAQSIGKMVVDDFKNIGGDMVGIWLSPFRGSGRDWLLAAGAFGAFGVSMLADQSVSDWAIRNEDKGLLKALEPVRRGGVAYTGRTIVPPFAALYVAGIAFKNQGMRDALTGCASAWLAQSAIRKSTYLAVGRQRPDTAPDNPNLWSAPGEWENWQLHSFPAGHFANAMSCATFWNKRFNLGLAEPLVYGVALGIGVGRLADAGHWTSDTVLGGILGYAVGSEIARRSLSRKEDKASAMSRAQFDVAPVPGGAAFGMRVTF
jgi:membrane-associated phospholipid phosphatase